VRTHQVAGERFEVEAQGKSIAEAATCAVKRRAGGVGVDGPQAAPRAGRFGALGVGERRGAAALEQGHEAGQIHLRDRRRVEAQGG